MENNEKWEAVKRRNKTSILQSVNKFREEANKMKRKISSNHRNLKRNKTIRCQRRMLNNY